jgi:CheY-like chemotaxis protein
MTPWEDLGCCVVGEADSGLAGLETVKRLHPDIVITDIRMPGIDGISMISRLEQELSDGERPKYIIVSGYSDFTYAQSAIRYGVKSYLLKPVDDDELHETLRNLVSEVRLPTDRKRMSGLVTTRRAAGPCLSRSSFRRIPHVSVTLCLRRDAVHLRSLRRGCFIGDAARICRSARVTLRLFKRQKASRPAVSHESQDEEGSRAPPRQKHHELARRGDDRYMDAR